jgi:hypothetical protein
MRFLKHRVFAAILLLFFPGFMTLCAAQEKQVIGWIEKVRIHPGNLILRAKLDTGAENSSINALSITDFVRDGKKWIRFGVSNLLGEQVILEREMIRMAEIKRKGTESQKRPVIHLGICLGGIYREVEVNLVDRSKFDYWMLIGRSFMEGHFVVDPSVAYRTEPHCRAAPQN